MLDDVPSLSWQIVAFFQLKMISLSAQKPYRGVSLLLSHHAGEIAALKARKTHLFEQLYTKMHHFTKTGSGQT